MSLRGELNSIKRILAEAGYTTADEKLYRNVRMWVRLPLVNALVDRACSEGRCVELRYHLEPQSHHPTRRPTAHIRYAWLLEAYDSAPGTPGHSLIGSHMVGFAGAPTPDPLKWDAATDAWVERYGLPPWELTIIDLLCKTQDYLQFGGDDEDDGEDGDGKPDGFAPNIKETEEYKSLIAAQKNPGPAT